MARRIYVPTPPAPLPIGKPKAPPPPRLPTNLLPPGIALMKNLETNVTLYRCFHCTKLFENRTLALSHVCGGPPGEDGDPYHPLERRFR